MDDDKGHTENDSPCMNVYVECFPFCDYLS